MDKLNDFMNMKVNMNEFAQVYNTYSTDKKTFGGGVMKVQDLLSTYLPKTNRSFKGGSTNTDNFFHTTRPSLSSTSINSMHDFSYKTFDFPGQANNVRS